MRTVWNKQSLEPLYEFSSNWKILLGILLLSLLLSITISINKEGGMDFFITLQNAASIWVSLSALFFLFFIWRSVASIESYSFGQIWISLGLVIFVWIISILVIGKLSENSKDALIFGVMGLFAASVFSFIVASLMILLRKLMP